MFNWVLNTHTSEVLIKTPEQHHPRHSCALIVHQILYIGFHAYLTYSTNSCFHCFEQVSNFWGWFQKLKNRWLNTLLKCSIRKSFGIKKYFANNNGDSRINEMLYSVKLRIINGKERFRFLIFYCLKCWQNFEMEVCLLRERGGKVLADKSC